MWAFHYFLWKVFCWGWIIAPQKLFKNFLEAHPFLLFFCCVLCVIWTCSFVSFDIVECFNFVFVNSIMFIPAIMKHLFCFIRERNVLGFWLRILLPLLLYIHFRTNTGSSLNFFYCLKCSSQENRWHAKRFLCLASTSTKALWASVRRNAFLFCHSKHPN